MGLNPAELARSRVGFAAVGTLDLLDLVIVRTMQITIGAAAQGAFAQPIPRWTPAIFVQTSGVLYIDLFGQASGPPPKDGYMIYNGGNPNPTPLELEADITPSIWNATGAAVNCSITILRRRRQVERLPATT